MDRWAGGVCGLCLAIVVSPVSAQVSITVSAGARYTSTLVHDSIVTAFTVRPAIAPAAGVAVSLPLDRPWSVEALVDLSTSEVSRHDADGSAAPITRLTTVGIGVLLRRDAPHGLSAAAGAGLLIDIPGDRIGIYRDGSSIAPFGEGLVDYTPPVAALRGLSLELRYDLHGFLTPALRQEGFVNSQIVHRVALALRYPLRRGAGSREPRTGS